MKNILIASVFLVGLICQGTSLNYSYDRPTLRELIGTSDFIFRVKVVEIRGDIVDDRCIDCTAILSIQDKLKGDYIKRKIEVAFSETSICPPSARYRKDENLLVFLFYYEDTQTYRTTAGLDGMLYVYQENDYDVYKNRIMELLDIFKIEKTFERDENIVNWIVDNFDYFYYDDDLYRLLSGNDKELIAANLIINENQKTRLRKKLIKKDILSYYDCRISKLLIAPGDTFFLDKLISLSKDLSGEELWSIAPLLDEISRLTGDNDLVRISEKINSVSDLEDNYIEQIEPLVKEFISKI